MASSTVDDAIADVVNELLAERDVGGVHIVAVTASLSTGSDDEPVVRLVVTLRDPAPEDETWPIDDVWRFRTRVYDLIAASAADLPRPLIDLQPETPDGADPA